MSKKLFFIGVIFTLLLTAAATPFSVRAEGDPPPNPEPVKPPWITGINPNVSLSIETQEELTPGGVADLAAGVEVPLLAAPPDYVELVPQESVGPSLNMDPLAVPQRFQDPLDNTCGAAALGMALEFLSLNGDGGAPSQAALVADLKNSGLLYKTGTGVEELAFLARQHGYQGTSAFHDWTLAQLKEQLGTGKPVVVSLGSNGEGQAGHFVTLTGISADGTWVSYNDPILGKQTVSADDFQKLWDLQGNSGLVARKEPLSAVDDPMLPWMGLFSAMAALAVIAKQVPLGNEITSVLENIRNILSNPLRKGLAGKLIAEGGRSSAPHGYKWIPTNVPVYGWKNFKITLTKQVPILKRTRIQAGTRVWYEKVPRYRTVRVDQGRWATRKVTKYKYKKYIRYYRTTRVRKTRWVRRGWRLVKQTYYVTKRTPVYGTRKVPYTTTERYWKSNWVTKQVPDGYRSIRKTEPIYEYRMLPTGKTRTEYYTNTERRWTQLGTDSKWKLAKLPDPPKIDWEKKEEFLTGSGKVLKSKVELEDDEQTPTPTPPIQTPTPTPDQATTTATPFYPTQGSSPTATVDPTQTYTATPSATPDQTNQWTPEPDPLIEGIIEGGDALLDHYSKVPPLPGDPPPAIDPTYNIFPPGTITDPNIFVVVKLVEGALTLVGTLRDLIKLVVIPVVEYFQNAVPTYLDPSYPEPTPPNPTTTSTPPTQTPTVNYPTPTFSPSPTPSPTSTEDQ